MAHDYIELTEYANTNKLNDDVVTDTHRDITMSIDRLAMTYNYPDKDKHMTADSIDLIRAIESSGELEFEFDQVNFIIMKSRFRTLAKGTAHHF